MAKKLLIGVIAAVFIIVAILFLLSKPVAEKEESLPAEQPEIPEQPEAGEQITIRDSQLQISSVVAKPAFLKEGETLKILFSIKNVGIGDSSATKAKVYVDNLELGEVDVPVLLQGAAQSFEYAWVAKGAGDHTAKVIVEYADKEPADNEGKASFTVLE